MVAVSGIDRGEERRRLLDAVRTEAETTSTAEATSAAETGSMSERTDAENRPEPAPDGGIVALEAPLFHCAACDRTYLEAPTSCDGCGGEEFVEQHGP